MKPFIVPAIKARSHASDCDADRLLRSMIDVLPQDLHAHRPRQGLLPSTVVIVHALKNAMIPFVTMATVQFGYMIGIQVTIGTSSPSQAWLGHPGERRRHARLPRHPRVSW